VAVYKSKYLHKEPISSRAVSMKKTSFLRLSSQELARQMTLLDMELFQNIDVAEMLTFAKAQNDENSPNLNRFTEHFNKMSFWAQTQILYHKDQKTREKYVLKFIKIMKYLRSFNNFNSFLALLSALQSTDITRCVA
jgi:Rap guanine nucleotide exchange factor 1